MDREETQKQLKLLVELEERAKIAVFGARIIAQKLYGEQQAELVITQYGEFLIRFPRMNLPGPGEFSTPLQLKQNNEECAEQEKRRERRAKRREKRK